MNNEQIDDLIDKINELKSLVLINDYSKDDLYDLIDSLLNYIK